ncbi:MAG: hypothetical protein IJT88_09730 [Kiritimatiellae bacterium]|nr:hypothetical protein [Kiritimatiellia bacterium]
MQVKTSEWLKMVVGAVVLAGIAAGVDIARGEVAVPDPLVTMAGDKAATVVQLTEPTSEASSADFDPFEFEGAVAEQSSGTPEASAESAAAAADAVEVGKAKTSLVAALDDAAEAQKKGADLELKAMLDANRFKYEISDSGNFRAIMEFESGRTQLVVISSSTEQLGEMFIREVYSLGGEGMLTRGELLERMEDSSAKKLGAWQVLEGKLLFVAKVPGDLDFEDLEAVIWAVAKSADAYEEEALETDEY